MKENDNLAEIASVFRHFTDDIIESNSTSNLQMVNIDIISCNLKNLRKHSKKQLQKLKNAINKVGYVNPILLDENHIVVAGELRLLAAKELKFTQIPAIILKNLTKEEADAIRILDNRIAEDGEWNYENLKIEIEKLMKFDYSFEELAFETIDYEKIFLNKNSDDNKVHNSDKEDESWLDTNIPPIS